MRSVLALQHLQALQITVNTACGFVASLLLSQARPLGLHASRCTPGEFGESTMASLGYSYACAMPFCNEFST